MTGSKSNQKLLHLFAAEAQETIQAITQSCLALEKGPTGAGRANLAADSLRHIHNLKGSARALGLDEISALVHGLETLFVAMKRVDFEPGAATFDLIYLTLDRIGSLVQGTLPSETSFETLLNQLETAAATLRTSQGNAIQLPAGESTPAEMTAAASEETIRVTVGKLDAILNLVNELQVIRLGLERSLTQMRHILYDSGDITTQVSNFLSARAQFNDLYRYSAANYNQLNQLLFQLQETVRQARMLPLATLFHSLPRLARNLSRELGKEVALHIEGGDIELDRSVLEQIKSPIYHLLYNAIDHGLELPEERLARGKPQTGRISITAVQRGNSVVIEMSDDGAGIDLAGVKEQAVRRELLTAEEAGRLDEQGILWLLFQSGFSTADTVTAISGRGVGLDIVRRTIESMQGTIFVENQPGRGVRFSLSLPVSITTSLCLLLQVNHEIFALPARNVTHLTRIRPEQVQQEDHRLLLAHPGTKPVPAICLAHLLMSDDRETGSPPIEEYRTAVIIGPEEQPVALLVDDLYEIQEIVVKKLPMPLGSPNTPLPYISGASILGTGMVILVLNVTDLIRAATHPR